MKRELNTMKRNINLLKAATKLMSQFWNKLFQISLEKHKLKKNIAFSMENYVRKRFHLSFNLEENKLKFQT